MNGKLPPDAFSVYVAMGMQRSYTRVADHFGVSKRSVVKRATAENWAGKLLEAERQAAARAEERAVETLDQMNERHLKIAKALQGKALEALRALPLSTARDIIKALDLGLKHERLARGNPEKEGAQGPAVVIELVSAEGAPADGETTEQARRWSRPPPCGQQWPPAEK